MTYKINNMEYMIIEMSQEDIRKIIENRAKAQMDEDLSRGRYMGVTCSDLGIIYLDQDLPLTKQRNVLIHELTHAYIDAYVHHFNSYSEEAVCDLVANSHDIIRNIVDKYYEGK